MAKQQSDYEACLSGALHINSDHTSILALIPPNCGYTDQSCTRDLELLMDFFEHSAIHEGVRGTESSSFAIDGFQRFRGTPRNLNLQLHASHGELAFDLCATLQFETSEMHEIGA